MSVCLAIFYTYTWLRPDGTPYYVGKGSEKDRAYTKHRTGLRLNPPSNKDHIIVQLWPDEATAFAYERYQIDFWGRKDLGTGCLRNLTDGGEGSVGAVRSEETRQKMGAAKRGKKQSVEHRRHNGEARMGRKDSQESRHRKSQAHKGKSRAPFSERHRRSLRKPGILGRHIRWHVNRGIIHPSCFLCGEKICLSV